jgi:predicted dienelactone hydrolase
LEDDGNGYAKSDSANLQKTRYPVGYQVLSFNHEGWGGKMGRVDVAVWYPSGDPVQSFEYDFGRNKVETNLAVSGAVLPGKYPLILYSHGATGSGISMAFLTERLASQGYVVVGPDYPDQFFSARIREKVGWKPGIYRKQIKWLENIKEHQLNKGGRSWRRSKLAYRPNIASSTIDLILDENKDKQSPFHEAIDTDRIAAVGHSFGAWTSLLIAGADSTFHDQRIKAAVALSGPVNQDVYESDELAQITIPVMFMFGGEEPKAGRASDQSLLYSRARPPKFLVEIEGADHFTFSGGIRKEFPRMDDYVQQDSRRAAIVIYTTAFLDYWLRGDDKARKQLQARTDSVMSYLHKWD